MSDLSGSLRMKIEEGKENVENDLPKPETEEEEERELPEWMLRKLKAKKGEGSVAVIIAESSGSAASNDQATEKENINEQNKDTLEANAKASQPTSINGEDSQQVNDNSGTSTTLAEDETSVSSIQHSQQDLNVISDSSTMLAAADEDEASVSPTQQKRVPCKYGEQCYRRNPAHKEEYSHPGDEDYSSEQDEAQPTASADAPDLRPECEYGTSCYRQNPQHKRDFKHTQAPAQPAASADSPKAKKTRKPAKRKRKADDDEYESEGDNEYDLNDSFLEDSGEEEEEEKEDEEDDDYVPDKEDPELLDENQWKETEEDGPEVLELLKEARDYLRNKKMHK